MTITKPTRLGILTPSSNTALEPITGALVAAVPDVSAHFARFPVTEISLTDKSLGQFDFENILVAAEMLADAQVDVIGWSGTSGGWLGFERDQYLCEQIQQRTGIPATTSILALNELMELAGIRKLALVSPYTDEVQQRIVRNYAAIGIDTVAEEHLDITVNFDFGLVKPETLMTMIGRVAQTEPQAVATYCTNLHAAQLAHQVEAQFNTLLLDTTSTVIWKMLRMAGIDTRAVKGWGRMFELG